MAAELKATVINMKTLNQDIEEPIVIGEGDMEGRKLRIIFTQEAAAQFTPNTKVYFSWKHQELDIRGYNVFTEIKNPDDKKFPPTWEITYPKSMLYEGHVLANVQLVDDVSIATSTNFLIHVLVNPDDGTEFVKSNDYSAFQNAILELANVTTEVQEKMDEYENEFEEMQLILQEAKVESTDAKDIAATAQEIANQALDTTSQILSKVRSLENAVVNNTEDITNIVAALHDLEEEIRRIEQEGGITEQEALNLINQQLINYTTKAEAEADHTALWNALQIQEFGFE